MKFSVVYRLSIPASASPYRLLDERAQEVPWANVFLDAQYARQLSPRSLRAYAFDLLHFARWFQNQPRALSEITESMLLDYVRHQLSQQPRPTPQTVNHRLTVIRCLYRFHLGQEIPSGHSHFQRTYTSRCPVGYGRPQRHVAFGLRLKQPRRVIQPLSAEQVSTFWASFRTFRDLALVGLMLLDGLRSCEVLTLQLEDLKLADAHLHVLGKGRKQRTLLLPGEIMEVLQSYLRLERPLTNSPYLFISLKGRRRGQAVRRNVDRFPGRFMFHLTNQEAASMRSQSVIALKRNVRYQPFAFTEHGVVMLSAVLNSPRAVQMSVMVVEAFVRLREMITANRDLAARVEKLEHGQRQTASIIEVLVDEIDNMKALPPPPKRKIGFDL